MSIPFSKFQGFGNDYIVIEREAVAGVELASLAKAMCRRNTGAGSDGIAVLEKRDGATADYYCEIVNPDGSLAGLSGNGTRCAVAHLFHSGAWSGNILRLETRSGVKTYKLLEAKGNGEYWFEAEIGRPRFSSDDIPVLTRRRADAVVNEPIAAIDGHHTFSAVNVGNPVACIFVETFDFDWRTTGRSLETHDAFPQRANIVFVKVLDGENIELRIWERGAGETAASGTCSAGAAVLSAFLLKTGRKVRVHSPGGMTEVLWRLEDDEIVLTGRADFVYRGEWPDGEAARQ